MIEQARMMGLAGKRSVDDSSHMLKRLFFIEKELMRTLGGYLINVSNWELKKKLPLHIWQDSLRADFLRTRVLEMRYPRRDVDTGHDPRLEGFLAALICCRNDSELIMGAYYVVKKALIDVYEGYLEDADPIDDAPSIAFMKYFPNQLREQLSEAEELYSGFSERATFHNNDWQDFLIAYVSSIGGLMGKLSSSITVPEEFNQREAYVPPLIPKRDPNFIPAAYHMPPWDPTKFIERQVWQGINHVNEIWASEITGLVMWKWNQMPWEFYLECARWAYDESRHCMMGEERMKAWGFEVGIDYPVVADHYISASLHGELEVLAFLHQLESGGPIWKSGLKTDFEQAGDTASSQDFDYDWADESIHLLYGHKWVLHYLKGDLDKLEAVKETTIERWYEWIEQQRREWDYEPFATRIKEKIKQIEAN